MEKLKQRIDNQLKTAIGLTVSLVLGVIFLIVGFTQKVYFLSVIAYVCIMFGVVFAPIMFYHYFKNNLKYKILDLIVVKGVKSLTTISSAVRRKEEKVKEIIEELVKNGVIENIE